MISVVDYGVANLASMLNMLRKIGVAAERVGTSDELESATKIVLPGIGAFDQGMLALEQRGLLDLLRRKVRDDGVPILGVCLGMQLLGRGSEEGRATGLGLIDATCMRFRPAAGVTLKVPHMGWNSVVPRRPSALLEGLDEHARFYFVHSYHLVCSDPADELAFSRYGASFTSIVAHGNVYGVQFHPEKSHLFGMTLLRNFAKL